MRVVPDLLAPAAAGDDKIDLVCSSGHRTTHSLARVIRLNDGWCGQCGADISYKLVAEAGEASPGDAAASARREPASVQTEA